MNVNSSCEHAAALTNMFNMFIHVTFCYFPPILGTYLFIYFFSAPHLSAQNAPYYRFSGSGSAAVAYYRAGRKLPYSMRTSGGTGRL